MPLKSTPISLHAAPERANMGVVSSDSLSDTAKRERRESRRLHPRNGASFFEEIVEGTHLLRAQVEELLSELVALGVVSSDSFAGLRALLTPEASASVGPLAGAARASMARADGLGLAEPAEAKPIGVSTR